MAERLPVWRSARYKQVLVWTKKNTWQLSLAACSLFSYLILARIFSWFHYEPGVGVYVTIMGVLIATMSLRKEPSRTEKALWLLFIMVFAVLEIRDINRETNNQAKTFSQISQSLQATKQGLDATSQGINQAVQQGQAQFKDTMGAVNQTLLNTQPFADLELVSISPTVIGQRINVGVNDHIGFNIFYQDVGNAPAKDIQDDAKAYVGPLDDLAFQKEIGKEFDLWWSQQKRKHSTSRIVTVGAKPFFTFYTDPFTEAQIKALQKGDNTIYVLSRWVYTDATGRWIGDNCGAFQDPRHDLTVGHPCHVHDIHRYRQ